MVEIFSVERGGEVGIQIITESTGQSFEIRNSQVRWWRDEVESSLKGKSIGRNEGHI